MAYTKRQAAVPIAEPPPAFRFFGFFSQIVPHLAGGALLELLQFVQ